MTQNLIPQKPPRLHLLNSVVAIMLGLFIFSSSTKGQSGGSNFVDYGSSVNAHDGEGTIVVEPSVQRNSAATEGQLTLAWLANIRWHDGGCNGSGLVYNRIGIWSTNVNFYSADASSIRTGVTGQIGYFNNNPNIYELGRSKFDGAAFLGDIGPGQPYSLQILHNYGQDNSGCDRDRDFWPFSGTTAKLKAVTNVTLQNIIYPKLSWNKGTKYADNLIAFEVLRKLNNGSYQLVTTLTGDKRAFVDNSLNLTGTYTYSIRTILSPNAPSSWNRDAATAFEPAVETTGIAFTPITLTATTTEAGRVRLAWTSMNAIAGLDYISIYRNNVELTQLSKSTKSYSDSDIQPGMYYNYQIGVASNGSTSLDENWRSGNAEGKSLPNGKISGYVKGKTNAGVEGIEIAVHSKVKLFNGKEWIDTTHTYLDTTTADGYYEIGEIFYTNGAEFKVTPRMPGYIANRFDPAVLSRKLTQDDNYKQSVNFTDTASFSIAGKALFTAIKDNNGNDIALPVPDAEVWLNGKNTTLKTARDGSYNLNITTPGLNTIELKYKNHQIHGKNSSLAQKSVIVNKTITNFDFEDKTTDTLFIKVAASCDAPIGEYAVIKLNSKQNGYSGNNKLQYIKNYNVGSYDWNVNPANYPGQQKSGEIRLILPAAEFQAQVTNIREKDKNGIDMINTNKLEYFTKTYSLDKGTVNLAQRDTTKKVNTDTLINNIPADTLRRPDGTIYQITPARKDTTVVSDTISNVLTHRLDFIYHNELKLELNGGNPIFPDLVPVKPSLALKSLIAQNDKYLVRIKIKENYSYRDLSYSCALDSGQVYVYDAISDSLDRKELRIDSITREARYIVKVGNPVLEAPYEKTIQIVGKVGSRQTSTIISAVVEGERARNATFVTKTPEIPLFVLHDPPGDKSFAKISKGTSISKTFTTQYSGGAGGGAYMDIRVGAGLTLPFLGKTGTGVRVEAQLEAGSDKNTGVTGTTTTTFTEDFSTSAEETLVGANGDVYVGASMNMVYALTDVLFYDSINKEMKRDTALAANLDDFNTTFFYTEYHIKNILLKQLATLYSIAKNDFDIALQKRNTNPGSITTEALATLNRQQLEYKASIDAWNKSLETNSKNRDEAKEVKLPDGTTGIVGNNISFSAGAIYDNSITLQKDTTNFSEVSVYLNGEVRAGVFAHIGDASEKNFGGLATFRFNWSKSNESTTSTSNTTAYHLEDNDLGDFLSVNLGEDKTYKTPTFKIVSGSSSCPHEINTQYRHLPAMQISGANEQRNVPSDQAAKFEILISNRSESDETVEYAVKLDPLSNPNGARVLVGGRDVTNGMATYYIPTGKSFKLPVEVYRGPLTSTYEGLSLKIFSTCDNTLDDISEEDIAKPSVKINAYFQNKCSEVDLFLPGNNWLVNQSNSDKLFVAFSKYDASTASPLTSIGLQYRKINQDYDNSLWSTVASFPKSVLQDKYYDYTFDVSGLPDGKYEIRAIAVCEGIDVNYSPVYSGTIDRISAVAFGTPSPRNGILTTGDLVGVTFNKDIVTNDISKPVTVTLKRKSDGMIIPSTVIGNGRDFEIRTVPAGLMGNYENEELVATIKNLTDVNGNKVADSVTWAFIVNLSPVYWSPSNITVNAIENQQSTFSGKLMNKVATTQAITITKYPNWLTPSIKTANIVARGELNIDFIINKDLNTGTYLDTVVALVDNKKQFLYVSVNVLRTPPNWTVTPANYRYNMSVTTQFSLDNSDLLTSKDIRDKLGVFVGDECRGVANIVYDRDLNKYVAYLTAYSNTPANENMTIHLWDTYPGLEYQARERLTFVANGIAGNLQNPLVVHPEGIYQTIPLKKGWTWFSLNVQHSDMKLSNVLASLKPKEGDLIKTLAENNAYSQYSKTMGWVGKLSHLNVYNSYMIYLSQPDTLRVLGNFITQAANVQLNKGWNWTGYPMAINMELGTYLKNYEPANGSQIVSQEEFAQYNSTTKSWNGSLKYMRPGKGYKFYSGNDGFSIPTITYRPTTDPAIEKEQQNLSPIHNPAAPVIVNNSNTTVTSTVNNTSVNTVNYENNSSVTTVINQGGTIVNNTTNRYETYVYVENKLVNIVNQVTLPNGQAVGFIPVNGDAADEGKSVQIKVYDKEEQKEYTAKVEDPVKQQTDLITGTLEKPVVLILEGLADVGVQNSLVQNLVNKGEEFSYQLKLKNAGPDLAVNVTLTDTLATIFDYIGSDNGMIYDPAKRVLKANILQLRAGEEQHFLIRIKANKVGAFNIGNGFISVNNDNRLQNNRIPSLSLNVVDKRANTAKLLIPSMFTPNGDGINDKFEIVGLNEYYVTNSLVVFNKNYNQVYRKQNYQNDWTGDNLPMGSYGYILKATDKDNKEVVYKGFITIVYQ